MAECAFCFAPVLSSKLLTDHLNFFHKDKKLILIPGHAFCVQCDRWFTRNVSSGEIRVHTCGSLVILGKRMSSEISSGDPSIHNPNLPSTVADVYQNNSKKAKTARENLSGLLNLSNVCSSFGDEPVAHFTPTIHSSRLNGPSSLSSSNRLSQSEISPVVQVRSNSVSFLSEVKALDAGFSPFDDRLVFNVSQQSSVNPLSSTTVLNRQRYSSSDSSSGCIGDSKTDNLDVDRSSGQRPSFGQVSFGIPSVNILPIIATQSMAVSLVTTSNEIDLAKDVVPESSSTLTNATLATVSSLISSSSEIDVTVEKLLGVATVGSVTRSIASSELQPSSNDVSLVIHNSSVSSSVPVFPNATLTSALSLISPSSEIDLVVSKSLAVATTNGVVAAAMASVGRESSVSLNNAHAGVVSGSALVKQKMNDQHTARLQAMAERSSDRSAGGDSEMRDSRTGHEVVEESMRANDLIRRNAYLDVLSSNSSSGNGVQNYGQSSGSSRSNHKYFSRGISHRDDNHNYNHNHNHNYSHINSRHKNNNSGYNRNRERQTVRAQKSVLGSLAGKLTMPVRHLESVLNAAVEGIVVPVATTLSPFGNIGWSSDSDQFEFESSFRRSRDDPWFHLPWFDFPGGIKVAGQRWESCFCGPISINVATEHSWLTGFVVMALLAKITSDNLKESVLYHQLNLVADADEAKRNESESSESPVMIIEDSMDRSVSTEYLTNAIPAILGDCSPSHNISAWQYTELLKLIAPSMKHHLHYCVDISKSSSGKGNIAQPQSQLQLQIPSFVSST